MARPPRDPQIRINEILDVAEALFYKRGYRTTMISDIVKKIGVAIINTGVSTKHLTSSTVFSNTLVALEDSSMTLCRIPSAAK